MLLYLSRWVCRDVKSNLERLADEAAAASAASAAVVVFPEGFLHGYTRFVAAAHARRHFTAISQRFPSTLFVFGSISEERRNRMTVWLEGREVARYDKVHLFAPNGETGLWEEGDHYVAVRALGQTFGLLNCNDVRFPEQARALRLAAGCNVLLAVAWWPWRRDHVWRTLLRARAIENAAWVIGCCVAASEHPGERFAGAGNYVFDLHGEAVRPLDDNLYELNLEGSGAPLVDPQLGYRAITHVEVVP